MNYARFINRISAYRRPSIIREMTALLARCGPEMIPLSGGLPNPEMFPFKSATLAIKDGSKIDIAGAEMASALQYLPTSGLGELVTRLKDWQKVVHNPSENTWENSELVVTSGCQDGLCKAFEMLLNEGDSVIVEVGDTCHLLIQSPCHQWPFCHRGPGALNQKISTHLGLHLLRNVGHHEPL